MKRRGPPPVWLTQLGAQQQWRVTAKLVPDLPRGLPARQIGSCGHGCVRDRAPGLVARSKLHAAAQQDFLADDRAVSQLEAGVDQRIATHTAQHRLFRYSQGQAGGNDGHVRRSDRLVRTTHWIVVVTEYELRVDATGETRRALHRDP